MPRVTVLMPVYNAERFVAASVRSILVQTFDDYEFIIINDGSTDGTLAIVQELAGNDTRIRLISRPNTGLGVALNEGLGLARAPYLARIDGDDLADPQRLEQQVAALDADPSLVCIGSNAIVIDEFGDVIGDYDVPLTHQQIEAAHLRGSSSIHHPAAMMRIDAVRKVGGYRVHCVPCEDFDLWLRLGEVGRLANLPQRLLTKRLLISGAVVNGADRHARVLQGVMDDMWKRRHLPGCFQQHSSNPRRSRADFYRQWAWQALKHRNIRTSRRYARRAVICDPFDMMNWRLAYCSLRGR